MCDVKYEDLVADPQATIQRLLDACGLGWNPACLDFHVSDRTVRTASYQQIRRPLYSSSVGRWKNYAAHLGTLIEHLDSEIHNYFDM